MDDDDAFDEVAGAPSSSSVRAKDARWQAVYLVCKECQGRSSGPKKLKSKALAREIRAQTKHASVRSRIVMTRCLGLCPKSAAAVACAGSAGVRLVAVRSRDEVPAALAALRAPRSTDAPVAVVSGSDRVERPA